MNRHLQLPVDNCPVLELTALQGVECSVAVLLGARIVPGHQGWGSARPGTDTVSWTGAGEADHLILRSGVNEISRKFTIF